MTSVAVIAHTAKELGGVARTPTGPGRRGVTDPLWREVSKSKQVPKHVRDVLERGADVIFVWGGDGTVQRCADSLAGTGATLAILPAGTANLLATNLGVPKDIREAVRIGLHGERRPLDLGVMNGEHFAVMAGVGLDALMIRDAFRRKDRFGRMAYVVAERSICAKPMRVRVHSAMPSGSPGRLRVSCSATSAVLGDPVFHDARPDDGCTASSRRRFTRWAMWPVERQVAPTGPLHPNHSWGCLRHQLNRCRTSSMGDRKPRKRFSVTVALRSGRRAGWSGGGR
jgi:hypothetical protein